MGKTLSLSLACKCKTSAANRCLSKELASKFACQSITFVRPVYSIHKFQFFHVQDITKSILLVLHLGFFSAKLHLLKDVEHGMAQRIAPHATMVVSTCGCWGEKRSRFGEGCVMVTVSSFLSCWCCCCCCCLLLKCSPQLICGVNFPHKKRTYTINYFYLKMSILQVNGFIEIGVSESYNLICSSAEKNYKNIYHIYSNLTTKKKTIRLEWFRYQVFKFSNTIDNDFCGTPLQNTPTQVINIISAAYILHAPSGCSFFGVGGHCSSSHNHESGTWLNAISVSLTVFFSTSVIMEQRVVLRC